MINKLGIKKGDIVMVNSWHNKFFKVKKQKTDYVYKCLELNKNKSEEIFYPFKILSYEKTKRFKSDYELLVFLKFKFKEF